MERSAGPTRGWKSAVIGVLIALVFTIFLPMLRDYDPQPMPKGTGKVVVVGMVGVPWEAIDSRTPTLLDLSQTSTIANTSVRTFSMTTCPVGGWMTLNSGVRSAGISNAEQSCVESSYVLAQNPSDSIDHLEVWEDILANNEANRFNPQFGLLGETIVADGRSVAAVGPGAAVAIADRDGDPLGDVIDVPMNGPVTENAVDGYRAVSDADLVVIDLGSAHRDSTPASQLEMTFIPPGGVSARTLASTARIDSELGLLLEALEPGTTLIVASLGDSDREAARLQLYLQTVIGEDTGGLATSASTRQPGIIQNVDVQAAIFDAFGLDVPAAAAGVPPRFLTSDDGPAHLADVNERAIMTRAMVGLFYVLFVVGVMIIFAGVATTIRGGRFGIHHLFSLLVSAAMPAASFLVNLLPWWRAGRYGAVTFTIGVAAIAMGIAAIALRLAQARTEALVHLEKKGIEPAVSGVRSIALAPAFIALVTAATIGIDAALGSPLHSISVLGDQPQSGGRFYGMSNAPFAIWAVSMIFLTLIAVTIVKSYRAKVAVPAVIATMAFIAIYINGAPHIGADFGGPPALVLGFGVFALLVFGVRITFARVVILGAAAALSAVAIAFLDWLRPPASRTHLGQFFQSLLDGEGPGIVLRKFEQLVGQVPWFGWIAAALLLAFMWFMAKRAGIRPLRDHEDCPELRAGAIAALVTLVSAMFINDSGLVIPLIGGMYLMCLWSVAGLDGNENERYGRNLFEEAPPRDGGLTGADEQHSFNEQPSDFSGTS